MVRRGQQDLKIKFVFIVQRYAPRGPPRACAELGAFTYPQQVMHAALLHLSPRLRTYPDQHAKADLAQWPWRASRGAVPTV